MKNLARRTALVSVVGVVVLGGCEAQEVPEALDAAAAHRVEARADAIYTKMWGTGRQREAQHYLEFKAMNRPTVDCMRRSGHTFTLTYESLYTGVSTNSTQSSGWMGKLEWSPSAGVRKTTEAFGVFPPHVRGSNGYESALDSCLDSNQGPVRVQAGAPPMVEKASTRWSEMLDSANDDLGSMDEYVSCMEESGLQDDGEYLNLGATGLSRLLNPKRPSSAFSAKGPNAEWREYLKKEEQVLKADRVCREERYYQGLAIIGAELDPFEAEYGDELRGSEAAWEAMVMKAEAAGFSAKHYRE